MRAGRLIAAVALLAGLTASRAAASEEADVKGPRLDNTVVQRWRVGVVVTAGGPCRGIVATTSVPSDWPEQQVTIVDDKTEVSRKVRLRYRMIDGAVKQMTASIPSLAAGEQAKAIVTVEVKRSWQLAPENTDLYVLANPKRLDRKMQAYLLPSPQIESTHPHIKALAEKIGVDEEKAWNRVEAIYDWVRENVKYQDNRGQGVKTTLQTLRDATGDCDELSSLFIAICRAGGIPARTVRVPGHCYPEFYLEDDQRRGHWFPCQASGTRAFGEMPEHRPVLQKGDNLLLRDPSTKKMKRYRTLPDNLIMANHGPGAAASRFERVCEPVEE